MSRLTRLRAMLLLCLLAMAMAIAPIQAARAAEATLSIKVRLVRCITQKERQNMCDSESLCCNLIEYFAESEKEKDIRLALAPSPNSIWISGPETLRTTVGQPIDINR